MLEFPSNSKNVNVRNNVLQFKRNKQINKQKNRLKSKHVKLYCDKI